MQNTIKKTRVINKEIEQYFLYKTINESLEGTLLNISSVGFNFIFYFSEEPNEGILDQIIADHNKEDYELLYNSKFHVNQEDDFSLWKNFYLRSTATINSWGDKENIQWIDIQNRVAVEEFPLYTRTKQGNSLLSALELKRDLTIRYYRVNGSFEEVILPTKYYNEVERKYADTKARTNIIESTRQKTGEYIYGKNMVTGTPQNIEVELGAALLLLESLQSQIAVYRSDREHLPLVNALQSTTPTTNVPQDVLDFIINMVNIDYYD